MLLDPARVSKYVSKQIDLFVLSDQQNQQLYRL